MLHPRLSFVEMESVFAIEMRTGEIDARDVEIARRACEPISFNGAFLLALSLKRRNLTLRKSEQQPQDAVHRC